MFWSREYLAKIGKFISNVFNQNLFSELETKKKFFLLHKKPFVAVEMPQRFLKNFFSIKEPLKSHRDDLTELEAVN